MWHHFEWVQSLCMIYQWKKTTSIANLFRAAKQMVCLHRIQTNRTLLMKINFLQQDHTNSAFRCKPMDWHSSG